MSPSNGNSTFLGNSIPERPDENMSAAKPIFTLAGGIGLKSIWGS